MPPNYLQPHFGIEMLNVGKGDAIFIELKDLAGKSLVVMIDGGSDGVSEQTIAHFNTYYRGMPLVVVSTHPDRDHLGGLASFIKQAQPQILYINQPTAYADRSTLLTRARTHFSPECRDAFKAALERIDETIATVGPNSWIVPALVKEDGQPHLAWGSWNVYILNPRASEYARLWQDEDMFKTVYDNGDDETKVQEMLQNSRSILDDGMDTSGMNNSSAMVFIEGHQRKMLFTGDAGMKAFYLAATRKDITGLSFLDIPHHGSRRNLNSAIIAHLRPETAFVSAPGTDKHPRSQVIGAFQKIGSKVFSTHHNGTSLYHYSNIPRLNYGPANPYPLMLASGKPQ